jgi:PKD repeat protein
MSLPSLDRNEYPVSSIGIETEPQGIIVKGTLWAVQLGYGRVIVKEYEGQIYVANTFLANNYKITIALKNDLTLDTDRFWIWVVDRSHVLSLYEIEPYVASPPVITYSKTGLDTDITSVDVYVSAGNAIRVITLNSATELKSALYHNIRNPDLPAIEDLTWSGSRLSQISSYVNQGKIELDITYLDVASPPNVYIESYTIEAPQNLNAIQIGSSWGVLIDWDASIGANQYVLERDTTPSFLTPVSVTVLQTNYNDTVPAYGTYYYRVKAQSSSLLLESLWSSTISIDVIISIIVDFFGSPRYGIADLIVNFTDLTEGAVTAWDWDFGDGSPHSTEKNPVHTYTESGYYTVSLTVYAGIFSYNETKVEYIIVYPYSAEVVTENGIGYKRHSGPTLIFD